MIDMQTLFYRANLSHDASAEIAFVHPFPESLAKLIQANMKDLGYNANTASN